MIMYILFDLDGTLVNPFKRLYASHIALTRKHLLPSLSLKNYISAKKRKRPELFYLNTRQKYLKIVYEQEKEKLLENMEELRNDSVFKYAKDALRDLQKHHTLVLLTVRKKRNNMLKQLKKLGLYSFFSYIYSPEAHELHKKPEEAKRIMIEQFVHRYRKKEKIVIVGDTEADILAGRKMGIYTIAATYGLRMRDYLESLRPNYLISNLKQLSSCVKKLERETN